jgi:hypothetical protein
MIVISDNWRNADNLQTLACFKVDIGIGNETSLPELVLVNALGNANVNRYMRITGASGATFSISGLEGPGS